MFQPEGPTNAVRGARLGAAWLVRAAVVAGLSGGLVLVAALDASAQEPGDTPEPSDTSQPTPSVAADEIPMVVLSKTYRPRDPDPAEGESVTFIVTLSNESTVAARGYVLEAQTPAAVADPSWTCTATGAGSACGAEAGTGDLQDIADIGAGGTVVYRLTGTIASDEPFVQAVVLTTGDGQACAPVWEGTVATPGPAEQADDDYYRPSYPPAEPMVCRVNNELFPEQATVDQPPGPTVQPEQESLPEQGTPQLANTGLPLPGYAAIGAGAILLGGVAIRWSTRRRAVH